MRVSPGRVAAYLRDLTAYPDRHLGSDGNRAATALFAETAVDLGWDVRREEFDCLEWSYGAAEIETQNVRLPLHVGPYSPPAQITARLQGATTADELESLEMRGAIVLLHGRIASQQLMPSGFPFYNPESHKRVYRALDRYEPAAAIAATGRDPDMVGSQYPFPLFEDGDLMLPSAYLKDVEGQRLLADIGTQATLRIESVRIPSRAEQVVATRAGRGKGRIVVSAHIDSRKDSPGAVDNATGVVLLLCLAELLRDWKDASTIELVPFNGEDNYSAQGQKVWLAHNEGRLGDILLDINIDDAGYKGWGTHVSFYGCSEEVKAAVLEATEAHDGCAAGPEWYQGDHSIFAMKGIPAVAIASAGMGDFMARHAHSASDTPEMADVGKIAEIAGWVRDIVDRVADLCGPDGERASASS